MLYRKLLLLLVLILIPTVAFPYTFTGDSNDSNGTVSEVNWYNSNEGTDYSGDCTGTVSWTCEVTIGDGVNSITIEAIDNEGESGYAYCSVEQNIAIGDPPNVSVTSACGVTTNITTHTLNGVSDDPDGTVQNIYWVNNTTTTNGLCTGTESWTCNLTGLVDGYNDILIRAQDDDSQYGYAPCAITYQAPVVVPGITRTSPVTCPHNEDTDNPLDFTGTLAVGETVIVEWDGLTTGLDTCDEDDNGVACTTDFTDTGVNYLGSGAELVDDADKLYFKSTNGNNIDYDKGTIKFKFYGNNNAATGHERLFQLGTVFEEFSLYRNSDTELGLYIGGVYNAIESLAVDLWDDAEHEIVFLWDFGTSEVHVYIDDTLEETINYQFDLPTPTGTDLYLCSSSTDARQCDGIISDFEIYHDMVFPWDDVHWYNDSDTTDGACSGTDAWTCPVDLTDGENLIRIVGTDLGGTGVTDNCTVNFSDTSDHTDPTLTRTGPTTADFYDTDGDTTINGTASDNVALKAVNPITWTCTDCGTASGNASGSGTWTYDVTHQTDGYGDNALSNGIFADPTYYIDDLRDGTFDVTTETAVHMLYKFESGALATDDSATPFDNDLTLNNTPTASSTKKEGSYSIEFVAASSQSANINDSALDANHPLRSTVAAEDFTISFWVQIHTHTNYPYIFSKWLPNNYSIALKLDDTSGTTTGFANSPVLYFGHNSGTLFQEWELDQALTLNQWYWFQISYVHSSGNWYFTIYDDVAGVNLDGSPFQFTSGNARWNGDAPFVIGTSSDYSTGRYFDGLIDNFVVLDRAFIGTGWTQDPSWTVAGGVATNSGVDAAQIYQNVNVIKHTQRIFCYEIISPGSVGTIELAGYVGTGNEVTLSNVVGEHCTTNRVDEEEDGDSTVTIQTNGLWDGDVDNMTDRQLGIQYLVTTQAEDTSENTTTNEILLNAYEADVFFPANPVNVTMSNVELVN